METENKAIMNNLCHDNIKRVVINIRKKNSQKYKCNRVKIHQLEKQTRHRISFVVTFITICSFIFFFFFFFFFWEAKISSFISRPITTRTLAK